MAYQAKTIVVFDRTAVVARQYADAARQLRYETIDAIKVDSIANAAEETGSLKAGHYTTDERGSHYQEAVEAAQEKNPDVQILPEVPAEKDTSILAVCVAHAAAAEFYTGEENPGAHPYMTPAAESQRAAFERGVRDLGGTLT